MGVMEAGKIRDRSFVARQAEIGESMSTRRSQCPLLAPIRDVAFQPASGAELPRALTIMRTAVIGIAVPRDDTT
jgi:hypothetical protein